MQNAVAALERAVLRGPRPRAGSKGLAQALTAFRAELEKFSRREPSDCTVPIRALISPTQSSMRLPI